MSVYCRCKAKMTLQRFKLRDVEPIPFSALLTFQEELCKHVWQRRHPQGIPVQQPFQQIDQQI